MLKVKKLEERINHLEYELQLQGEELGTLMFQVGKLEEEVEALQPKEKAEPKKRGRKPKIVKAEDEKNKTNKK